VDNQLERKKMKLLSVGKGMKEWREKQRTTGEERIGD
jgi:hypothetical protein